MQDVEKSNNCAFQSNMESTPVARWILTIVMFCISQLVPSTATADVISDYTAYVQDRAELDQDCKHLLRGPDGKAMFNFENCRWRKDQILMRRYGLYTLLYDSGYDRYKELFEAARAAAIGKIEGRRQWMENWAWSIADIEYDYDDVQWSIIQRVSQ